MRNFFPLAALALLTACSQFPGVYKYPVEQGNEFSEAQIEQIQPGMEQGQVLFLLGTPALVNRLQNNRWIYTYTKATGDELNEARKIEVLFEDGRVSAVNDLAVTD